MQAARYEIFAAVSDHIEKSFVRIDDPTLKIPNVDSDDIGVDQSPDLGFAFNDIAVQAGVLQRDRGLRGEQLQHGQPGRREHVRGQVVFQVKHADELALIDQRQAEDGAGLVLMEIGVRGKWVPAAASSRSTASPYARRNGKSTPGSGGHRFVPQAHLDGVARVVASAAIRARCPVG